MERRTIATRGVIIPVILLQFIPIVLFPLESFSPNSQEWWLPVLLAVMVIAADVQLIFGHGNAPWPWHLMSFAQGFNIISRLMMVWPHATITYKGATELNLTYVGLTIVSVLLSSLMLWYTELPEVRMNVART
jgi:hypothetical protein